MRKRYSMAAELQKDTMKGLKGVSAMLSTVSAGGTLGTTARSMMLLDIAMDLRGGKETLGIMNALAGSGIL